MEMIFHLYFSPTLMDTYMPSEGTSSDHWPWPLLLGQCSNFLNMVPNLTWVCAYGCGVFGGQRGQRGTLWSPWESRTQPTERPLQVELKEVSQAVLLFQCGNLPSLGLWWQIKYSITLLSNFSWRPEWYIFQKSKNIVLFMPLWLSMLDND